MLAIAAGTLRDVNDIAARLAPLVRTRTALLSQPAPELVAADCAAGRDTSQTQCSYGSSGWFVVVIDDSVTVGT